MSNGEVEVNQLSSFYEDCFVPFVHSNLKVMMRDYLVNQEGLECVKDVGPLGGSKVVVGDELVNKYQVKVNGCEVLPSVLGVVVRCGCQGG